MNVITNLLRKIALFRSYVLILFRKFFPESRTNSIRFQISVLYTSILGIILIVFSGVLYVILSLALYVEPDYQLGSSTRQAGW